MLQMGATEFQIHCLKMLDMAYEKGESIVITKRGVPYAQLTPIEYKKKTIFGCMSGTSEVIGDIMDPIDEEWESQND